MTTDYFLLTATKLVIGLFIITCYIKLSGKGSLAPISALDQVGNIVLGCIIGGSLYNRDIGILPMVFIAAVWAGLLLSIRLITFKLSAVKTVIDGRSIRLMKDGDIVSANFVYAKLSVRDFIMLLHQRGYSNISDLSDVWFEYNGQLTVVKKGDPQMAIAVVENGSIYTYNLDKTDLTEEFIQQELERQKVKIEDVFLAEWHDDKLWIYKTEVTES